MAFVDIVLTTYNVLGREIHYADGAQVRYHHIRLQLAERVSFIEIVFCHATNRARDHYADTTSLLQPERNMRQEKRYARKRSPLTQIDWWRVVLDEAQMVENGVSNAAKVAQLIPRQNAWAVSGTPVKKDAKDLYGLLIFLRYQPYCLSASLWDRLVVCGLKPSIASFVLLLGALEYFQGLEPKNALSLECAPREEILTRRISIDPL